jgi:hypothetical protein
VPLGLAEGDLAQISKDGKKALMLVTSGDTSEGPMVETNNTHSRHSPRVTGKIRSLAQYDLSTREADGQCHKRVMTLSS